MTSEMDDVALANDPNAQLELILNSYAIGNADAIDQAIAQVSWARQMKKQGIVEFSANSDGPEGDA